VVVARRRRVGDVEVEVDEQSHWPSEQEGNLQSSDW
jgi:hypothetical protein